jgi:DNA-binding CsgD family transcriptional regulator
MGDAGSSSSGVAARVYRPDGTVEWCSSGCDDAEWHRRLDRAREQLVGRDEMALADGSAHRLSGAVRYILIVRTQASAPWICRAAVAGRQREVAELASYGATVDEIARHFSISPNTVHHHLKLVYRKLGVANRVELARALGLLRAG